MVFLDYAWYLGFPDSEARNLHAEVVEQIEIAGQDVETSMEKVLKLIEKKNESSSRQIVASQTCFVQEGTPLNQWIFQKLK